MLFNVEVLPALGGETIRPLCPNPIGENTSIKRLLIAFCLYSNLICSSGYNGVKLGK